MVRVFKGGKIDVGFNGKNYIKTEAKMRTFKREFAEAANYLASSRRMFDVHVF